MLSILRTLTASFAALALIAIDAPAQAQSKGKEQKEQKGDQKEKKAKQHKHHNGKDLVGDKIKTNGKHKFHEHGKHSAFVTVQNGKIAGVTVTHAEKGPVPVKKYKTNKKMADASAGGMQRVSFVLAQAQSLGSTWIGYAYIDDYGDEIIYWFEYEMILDGDTGAVEYVPVYG
jgi:hypothetical protein